MSTINTHKPTEHYMPVKLSAEIHGIEVDITASYTTPQQFDCFVYFCGRVIPYVPTTHKSPKDALEFAISFIDNFQASGGLAGYKQRIARYYADAYADVRIK